MSYPRLGERKQQIDPLSPSPGFYDGMSFEDYAAIRAVNHSNLEYMRRSPLAYKWHLDHPRETTPSMHLGHAAHLAILEPSRINEFAVWEGGIRRGAAWEQWKTDNAGRIFLTTDEYAAVNGMADAGRRSPVAAGYLTGGRSEVVMVWRDTVTNQLCKGRLDTPLISGGPVIVDVKTCRDAQPWRFERAAFSLGYHIQMGMYSDGYYTLTGQLPRVVIVAIENTPPHECAVYRVPPLVLEAGIEEARRLIARVQECAGCGIWPEAESQEVELHLPAWMDVHAGVEDLGLVEIER